MPQSLVGIGQLSPEAQGEVQKLDEGILTLAPSELPDMIVRSKPSHTGIMTPSSESGTNVG